MGDTLSIIFAVMVALIMMFFVPLVDTWELQDNLAYVVVYASTVDFVDTARNTGFISLISYDNYINNLNSTGNRYNVAMEHRKMRDDISFEKRKQQISSLNANSTYKYLSAYENFYTNHILNILSDTSSNNKYVLNVHDYFYVTVKNTNITQATLLTNMLSNDKSEFKVGCTYGGIVWD